MSVRSTRSFLFAASMAFGLIFFFQNCSDSLFNTHINSASTAGTNLDLKVKCTSDQVADVNWTCVNSNAVARSCQVAGQLVADGTSIQAYLSPTVGSGAACQSESRTCTNGILSGSFPSMSCRVGLTPTPPVSTTASCLFNGAQISSGTSVPAFMANSSTSCQSQLRICMNGVLSGTYQFPNCQSLAPSMACTFNGAQMTAATKVVAYNVSQATATISCQSAVRTCLTNGTLDGTFAYASCVPYTAPGGSTPPPVAGSSCTLDKTTVASGQSEYFWIKKITDAGTDCTREVRTCTSGVFGGNPEAKFTECTQTAARNCTIGGASILPGNIGRLYTDAWGYTDKPCSSLVAEVKCITGTGIQKFQYPSPVSLIYSSTCTDQNKPSPPVTLISYPPSVKTCTFGGRTVAENGRIITYSSPTGTTANPCVFQNLSCEGGKLFGNPQFIYPKCDYPAAAPGIVNYDIPYKNEYPNSSMANPDGAIFLSIGSSTPPPVAAPAPIIPPPTTSPVTPIINASDATAQIAAAYVKYLGRTASAAEIASQQAQISPGGITLEQVIMGIQTSPEASIIVAYQTYLYRTPSPSEVASRMSQYAAGTSVAAITAEVQNSPEAMIRNAYQTYLRRQPGGSEIAEWTNNLNGGLTNEQMRAAIQSSPEAMSFR